MPVTTRIQADAEGITDEDMVSLENPPQEVEAAGGPGDAEPAQFDEKEAYHPLFCISDNLPEEYFTYLKSQTEESGPWLEITTSDPYSESILARSKADFERTPHTRHSPPPFLEWSFPRLYEFHKTLLRPLLTNEGRSSHFAHFTFLAVDAACVQSANKEDWEIIVCSTGADFGESPATGPRPKVFRMPISEAMIELAVLETLTSTPKEVGLRVPMQASVMPPPALAGPPSAMLQFKWNALAGLPDPVGKGEVEVFEV